METGPGTPGLTRDNAPMARDALILFAAGRDRPGIVDRLTGVVYRSGCNIEDSRMAILGDEFALIGLVTGSETDLRSIEAELPRLTAELELTAHLKRTTAGARKAAAPGIRYEIHAVAADHPGIVHKLARVLHEHNVNVASLDTMLSNAPVSGTPVFSLDIEAEVPADVPLGALRAQLERVAEAENIDLEIRAAR